MKNEKKNDNNKKSERKRRREFIFEAEGISKGIEAESLGLGMGEEEIYWGIKILGILGRIVAEKM